MFDSCRKECDDIDNINPLKLGRCIKELERIYGIKQGGSGFYGNKHTENNVETPNNSETLKTQEQLAKEMGISVDTLNNYKKLAEMIPELEELVDTGIATPTTALAMIRNLSSNQSQFSYFQLITLTMDILNGTMVLNK